MQGAQKTALVTTNTPEHPAPRALCQLLGQGVKTVIPPSSQVAWRVSTRGTRCWPAVPGELQGWGGHLGWQTTGRLQAAAPEKILGHRQGGGLGAHRTPLRPPMVGSQLAGLSVFSTNPGRAELEATWRSSSLWGN